MSSNNATSSIQRKVKYMSDSLRVEGGEVSKDLDIIGRQVTQYVETAISSVRRLSSCGEAAMKKVYPVVSHELEVVDEQITIIRATISNNNSTIEEDLVEVFWLDKVDLSSSSNYLLRKIEGKLSCLQRDMKMVMRELIHLQKRVKEMLEAAEIAEKLFAVSAVDQDQMLIMYKEVSKVLGSLDMEITLLKVTVSSWMGCIEDDLAKKDTSSTLTIEDKKKQNHIIIAQVNKEDSEVMEVGNSVDTSKVYAMEVKDDNSPGAFVEESVENAEVDKMLDLKLTESPRLPSICEASDNNRQMVKIRVKVGFNRQMMKSRVKESLVKNSRASSNLPRVAENISTMARDMEQSALASTSSMVETYRRKQLEQVKRKLGEYGEPLMVGEYKQFMMVFDSGCPALFWLYADTEALYNLQAIIQRKMRGKPIGDGGGVAMGVGSMVLAWYTMDKAVYRAKVEEVIGEELYSVRYIDYGNSEHSLTKSDIYSWDNMLEMIPPQAVSCCFYKATDAISKNTSLTLKEMEAFTLLMKQSSPMQMVVHKRHVPPLEVFNLSVHQIGPEMSISLRGKDGRYILDKLSKLPAFRSCFGDQNKQLEQVLPESDAPTETAIKQLEALQHPVTLRPVPHPLHLQDANLVQVRGDDPPSPVHPRFTSRAVEKVMSWLDREETMGKEVWCSKQQEQENQSFEEPEFTQTRYWRYLDLEILDSKSAVDSAVKTSADQANQSKSLEHLEQQEQVSPAVSCKQDGDIKPATVENDDIKPATVENDDIKPATVENDDIKPATVDNDEYTAPSLAMQEVEEDEHGEFQFMVAHIVSPEEMYLHPVSENSRLLTQLEAELERMAGSEKLAREEEVVVGSVWTVLQEVWYRVRVNNVTHDQVVLQSLDHGHHLLVGVLSCACDGYPLHRLPPGLASTLPGLAVRCHMSRIRPVQEEGWDKLSLQMINSCQEGEEQHAALVVEKSESGSIGVVITLERQGKYSTVNQRLVEVGCAVSSLFGSEHDTDEVGDSGLVNDWDPMEEEYNSTINNYISSGRRSNKSLASSIHFPG